MKLFTMKQYTIHYETPDLFYSIAYHSYIYTGKQLNRKSSSVLLYLIKHLYINLANKCLYDELSAENLHKGTQKYDETSNFHESGETSS